MNQRNSANIFLKLIAALLLAACWSMPTYAQRHYDSDEIIEVHRGHFHLAGHIGHYVKTHKFLLIMDTLVTMGNAADAASTLRAAHYCPACIDSALGKNPSPAKTWGEIMAWNAGFLTINHLVYHHYGKSGPEPSWVGQKFFVCFFDAPLLLNSLADVRENAEIGPHDASVARARLISSFVAAPKHPYRASPPSVARFKLGMISAPSVPIRNRDGRASSINRSIPTGF